VGLVPNKTSVRKIRLLFNFSLKRMGIKRRADEKRTAGNLRAYLVRPKIQ
jgi:hypothetical protein